MAENGKDLVKNSATAIHDIESSSENVKDIVAGIREIADQTNVLAMNAAIQSAHAGEYGKGFAVVASEVRKLSEDSSESTGEINREIDAMLQKISHGVSSFDKVRVSLEDILKGTRDTTSLIQNISAISHDQHAKTSKGMRMVVTWGRLQAVSDAWWRKYFVGAVAYFSMEIALHPAIPTYSGGWGILAGDMIRAAADRGVRAPGARPLRRRPPRRHGVRHRRRRGGVGVEAWRHRHDPERQAHRGNGGPQRPVGHGLVGPASRAYRPPEPEALLRHDRGRAHLRRGSARHLSPAAHRQRRIRQQRSRHRADQDRYPADPGHDEAPRCGAHGAQPGLLGLQAL